LKKLLLQFPLQLLLLALLPLQVSAVLLLAEANSHMTGHAAKMIQRWCLDQKLLLLPMSKLPWSSAQ